jgi:hypothetical protein
MVVTLFVIGAGACWQIHILASGPDYGGRPLSNWMAQLEPDVAPATIFPGFHLSEAGITGVREVGTAELQTLVRLISKPKVGLKAQILRWSSDDRVPNSVKRLMIPIYPQSYNPAMAILFFRALGAEANPAIPALVEMLHVTDDARWAAVALNGIGSDGVAALENEFSLIGDGIVRANIMNQLYRENGLVRFVAKQLDQDSHSAVRMSAARNLGASANGADVAIPSLIKALEDRDGGVRFTACESLEQFGDAAISALAPLETLLNDRGRQVRFNASRALQAIKAAKALRAEN